MPAAEPGKSSHDYELPGGCLLGSAEEHALAVKIQNGIDKVEVQLAPRLESVMAAVVPNTKDRDRIANRARSSLREAIVIHVNNSPKKAAGFKEQLAENLQPVCVGSDPNQLRARIDEYFSLVDGEEQVFLHELANVNESATRLAAR